MVGGVNEGNIPEFMKAGASGFGVGGNLVNKEWIGAGWFDKVTELAKRYVAAVEEAKNEEI
jgi:2-dehydro-3-deoxyphosphogluconate aldolase/(4S)-4-hydroxy-2-oxoglutarate aldolase